MLSDPLFPDRLPECMMIGHHDRWYWARDRYLSPTHRRGRNQLKLPVMWIIYTHFFTSTERDEAGIAHAIPLWTQDRHTHAVIHWMPVMWFRPRFCSVEPGMLVPSMSNAACTASCFNCVCRYASSKCTPSDEIHINAAWDEGPTQRLINMFDSCYHQEMSLCKLLQMMESFSALGHS